MRLEDVLNPDTFRRLVQALERDARAARTRADTTGDARDLARLFDTACIEHPALRVLASEEGQASLAARFPDWASTLAGFRRFPWAAEATLRAHAARARGSLLGVELSIPALFKAMRSPDAGRRRAAEQTLEWVLGRLLENGGVQLEQRLGEETRRRREAEARAEGLRERSAASVPEMVSSPSGLVLPSAEIVEGISSGLLDMASVAALVGRTPSTEGPPPRSAPAPMGPDLDPTSKPHVEELPSVYEELRLIDALHSLRAALKAEGESDLGSWRAAAAGENIADFRPSSTLVFEGDGRVLPFEAPLVPIARPTGALESGSDAWSATAHLASRGVLFAGRELGAALWVTCATRAFQLRGLEERPGDLERSIRAQNLALLLRYFEAKAIRSADGDVDALREIWGSGLGSAPGPTLARTWLLESRLSEAPAEERSLYAHGEGLPELILRGLDLAVRLRDQWDEDWYRNPRCTRERVRELALTSNPRSETELLAWVTGHASL